jgi:putative FmdB family regulatory protein
MPIYEYRCKDCGTISEYLVGIGSKDGSLTCKQCGSPQIEKMISISRSLKGAGRSPGHTCCGREERCSTPPCSTESGCRRG